MDVCSLRDIFAFPVTRKLLGNQTTRAESAQFVPRRGWFPLTDNAVSQDLAALAATRRNFLGIWKEKNEDILTFNRRDVNPVSQSISRDGLQGRIDPVN